MLSSILQGEFSDQTFLKERYRVLVDPGIVDFSSSVHSHLIGYLNGFGVARGFTTAADCPPYWGQAHSAPNCGIIRPDGIWYTNQGRLVMAFEVERYKREEEHTLQEKAENLVLVSHQSPEPPELLLYVYWVLAGEVAPNLARVLSAFREPFVREGRRVNPPRCPTMVAKCLMGKRETAHLAVRSIQPIQVIQPFI